MAKSMIINKLGTKRLTMYVPCGSTEAQSFANAVLDGETEVLELALEAGTDTADKGRYVNVMIQDDTTNSKSYMKFIIKTSKHEGDVISALQGKTFNGVKADKVVVVGMQSAEF